MNRTRPAVERMAAQAVPAPDQLHRADPAPEQELAYILAQPRLRIAPDGAVRRRSWRPVLVVAVVLALLGAVPVVVTALRGDGSAPAAVTHDPPAGAQPPRDDAVHLIYSTAGVETDPATLLRRLADRAAEQPPPPRAGPVAYVRIRQGQTVLPGKVVDGVPTMEWVSGHEVWTAPDGSTREALAPDGRAPTSFDGGPVLGGALAPLPPDPAALERQFLEGHSPREDGGPLATGDWFEDLARHWHLGVVDPAGQASFLRVLATKPGITVAGAVTDRLGRRGVAVTARTDWQQPADLTLIFDPDTGALLGVEDLWPGGGPDDPGDAGYSTWVESAWVPAIGDRP